MDEECKEERPVDKSARSSVSDILSLHRLAIVSALLFVSTICRATQTGDDGIQIQDTRRLTDYSASVFNGTLNIRETEKDRDGHTSFLDRQKLECGGGVLKTFLMKPPTGDKLIHFEYGCVPVKIAEDSKEVESSADSSFGGLTSLDQSPAMCGNNAVMSAWSGVSEKGLFHIDFKCKTYSLETFACTDLFTTYKGKVSIIQIASSPRKLIVYKNH